MQLELDNHVAVVIGGASGIGRAISRAMAGEGARVMIADIARNVADVAAQLPAEGGRQHAGRPVDATDYDAMKTLAQQTHSEWGRVDHVVVAAGVGSGKYGFPFW